MLRHVPLIDVGADGLALRNCIRVDFLEFSIVYENAWVNKVN